MKNIVIIIILFSGYYGFNQSGVIKGMVIDKQSEQPLEGATIVLLRTETATGVITDINGRFTMTNVPLGRQSIQISFIGYESVSLPNIEVTAGKDVFVTVSLLESFNRLDEIVLTNNASQDRALNKLATVSARQFGLEEVTRFSGGRSDVGRLAANFAGVSSPDDSRNDIVIRGNSPTGLLWRLEGVPIPSPNHFSTVGTTGGPVSALNPNLLKNSDFITSAFPAEYGNAIGGVFDLGFRTGNTDSYEYSLQTGIFTGVEAMAEGPLGTNRGSFVVAARYSLVGLLGVGAGGTSAVPNYNDISFNIDFGKVNQGNLSFFGIIGDSDIEFLGDDIDEDDLFAAEDENSFVDSQFGVVGLKYNLSLTNNAYLRTILSSSYSSNTFIADRFIEKDTPQERLIRYTEADNTEVRLTLSTLYNNKVSSRFSYRGGLLIENFNVQNLLLDRNEQADTNGDGDPDLVNFRDIDENISLFQPYIQTQLRFTENLTLNAGVNSQYSTLNKQFVMGPRAAINYKVFPNHTINVGYGLHYQNIPYPLLFLNENVNGELAQTNRDLDFVQSSHYVLGYDIKLGDSWRGKIELYRQDIDNAGVESFSSGYSTLTEGADFIFDNDRVSLQNDGTGFNQGIEFTLEKFFSDSYYGLLTGSFFESKYEGSDGIERNSPFNNGYVINLLAGKEFKITGNHTFFADTRITNSGGRYFTPVNLEASQQVGFEVLREDEAFSQQYDDYFRWDIKFGIKINSKNKKHSHQLYLDFQNVTANENVFARRYNRLTNQVDQVDQIGFFPDFGYKFQF